MQNLCFRIELRLYRSVVKENITQNDETILFVAKVAALYAPGPIAKDSSRQSAHLRTPDLLFQTRV